MIRRLIILLLIVSCGTEPEPDDCAGVAGGTAVEDDCGVCNGDGSTCYGCMDINACNFNADATSDNNNSLTCDGNYDSPFDALCTYPCQNCINGGENCCQLYEDDSWVENPCQIINYGYDCDGNCVAEFNCANECVIGHTEIGCLFEGAWIGNTSQEPTSSHDEGHGEVYFSIDKFGRIYDGMVRIYLSYTIHGCEFSWGFRDIGLNYITINIDSSFSYQSESFQFNGDILSNTEISGTLSYLPPIANNCNQEEIQLTWSVNKENNNP